MNKAFTLIELLVVVLIIGILSAIALPQYQKAVEKTRISTMFPALKSLADATELYYLENGSYTRNVNDLSIQIPANCSYDGSAGKTGQLWRCGKDFILDNSGNDAILRYCPGSNSSYQNCSNNRVISVGINHLHGNITTGAPGEWYCTWGVSRGEVLCKTLGF